MGAKYETTLKEREREIRTNDGERERSKNRL